MIVSGNNLSMIRGDTEYISIGMKNSEGTTVNLVTGDTLYLTIKESPCDENIVLQYEITSFTDGKAIINILHTDTEELQMKDYVYDVQVNLVSGQVKTIIPISKFTLSWEVTYD